MLQLKNAVPKYRKILKNLSKNKWNHHNLLDTLFVSNFSWLMILRFYWNNPNIYLNMKISLVDTFWQVSITYKNNSNDKSSIILRPIFSIIRTTNIKLWILYWSIHKSFLITQLQFYSLTFKWIGVFLSQARAFV